MENQINKKILTYVLVLISLALISAFVVEYWLGHKPCKLCLYQRIPYFLSILIIIRIFFTKKYEKIFLLILSLIFLCSSALAFYHFGIEQGFFNESLACTVSDLTKTLSKEELLEQLKNNTISCKDVNFRIFGMSLAAINTIFSIVLTIIFVRLFTFYGKN